MPTGTVIREMREAEYPLLEDFLYGAIFIPEDFDGEIPRSIIREPELAACIEGFGTLPDDHCLVAEIETTVVGAAWARIVRTYGHVDDATPLLSISLLPEHRGRGIGTALMDRLLDQLRTLGHRRASLSVQKANPALRLYRRADFVDHREEGDELIMIKTWPKGLGVGEEGQ